MACIAEKELDEIGSCPVYIITALVRPGGRRMTMDPPTSSKSWIVLSSSAFADLGINPVMFEDSRPGAHVEWGRGGAAEIGDGTSDSKKVRFSRVRKANSPGF